MVQVRRLPARAPRGDTATPVLSARAARVAPGAAPASAPAPGPGPFPAPRSGGRACAPARFPLVGPEGRDARQ